MLRAVFYSIAVVWVNLYLCRELFSTPASSMASMQGYWIALAERAQGSFFQASWWPYWNCGMPFEFAYAPLVPAATAALAAIRGIPHSFAFDAVAGCIYVLGPLTLLWCAWRMTGSAGYSFLAAMLYSLLSPAHVMLLNHWQAGDLLRPWRLFTIAVWDEAPHLAAIALLPPTILLLWLAVRGGRWIHFAGAAALIALATYASAFAPVSILLASLALLAALDRKERARAALRIVLTGAAGYALSAAFLPPSLMASIAQSAQNPDGERAWTLGSFTAIAVVILGGTLVWPAVQRIGAPAVRFFIWFAYLASSIPMIAFFLHREFLPQPMRYCFEMELALSLGIAFGLRACFDRVPPRIKRAVVLLAIALAGELIAAQRHEGRIFLRANDVSGSIEYRTSMWVNRNLGRARVMLPGSIAQWAAAFAPIDQFAGGSWSLAANRAQQRGLAAIFGADARTSLAWLQSFGVSAVAVSGAGSGEYWKPYANPAKFEGVLPVLWRESGITIYQVPQRSAALAHVVPGEALVRRAPASMGDIGDVERYAAALTDASLPLAAFAWTGRNHARISSHAGPGQAISVQVTYDRGWRAASAGRRIPIHADGLGLMWLECGGACEIALDYTGSFELTLCRWLTALAAAGLIAIPLALRLRMMH